MSKNQNAKPTDHGITTEVKEELVKLGKKVESGELEGNSLALSKLMTDDIAQQLINLAKEVEQGDIGNEEIAMRLAKFLKSLSRGKVKSLKKRSKAPKTVFEMIIDQMLKTFVQNNINQKNGVKLKQDTLIKNLISDLDSAIVRLSTDPKLDSDINDVRLIEDFLAVNEKMASLMNRATSATKGLASRMFKATLATSAVGGIKNIATLSNLKTGMVTESWNDANVIDFDQARGAVSPDSHHELESAHEKMQRLFMLKSAEAHSPSGPSDTPITEAAKELKEKKNLEWEQSAASLKKSGQ